MRLIFLCLFAFFVSGCSSSVMPSYCKKIYVTSSGEYIFDVRRVSIPLTRNWQDLVPIRWEGYDLSFNILTAHVNYVESKAPISCDYMNANLLYKERAVICSGGLYDKPLGIVVRYEIKNVELKKYVDQTEYLINKIGGDLFCSDKIDKD